MALTIGTFNVNNLFSRFNYRGVVHAAAAEAPAADIFVEIQLPSAEGPGRRLPLTLPNPRDAEVRTYRGRLVEGKDPARTRRVAERIAEMDLDVVCLQEVEDIVTLRRFLADHLPGRYPHEVLIEGNDPRLIDVALISKLPLGAATSWQHAAHPADASGDRIFSRDLLEVEVLSPDRRLWLLTVYTTHLKSQFVQARTEAERARLTVEATTRRRLQAETIADIIRRRQRPDGRYLVLGDMNDAPETPALQSLRAPAPDGSRSWTASPRRPSAAAGRTSATTPRQVRAGRIDSSTPARSTTSSSTRSGSARRSHRGFVRRSSSGAHGAPATAATTTLRGSSSSYDVLPACAPKSRSPAPKACTMSGPVGPVRIARVRTGQRKRPLCPIQ
jgi:endonuclease/exonuclease/phosphatase family metal-dependent hydrolase